MAEGEKAKKEDSGKMVVDASQFAKLLEQQEKQVKYSRFAAIFTAVIAAVMVIVAVIVVPEVLNLIKQVDTTIVQVEETITQVDATIAQAQESVGKVNETLDSANGMVKSITNTSNNVNGVVTSNASDISKVVKDISQVDFEGLNQAINDLQSAVAPLANMFRSFR
ncbi:MAG: hypothetical protein J6P05_07240 [Lachnospiraceae bacterium]|nr:hypothetical protein [Lachnospiraceae bacterium]